MKIRNRGVCWRKRIKSLGMSAVGISSLASASAVVYVHDIKPVAVARVNGEGNVLYVNGFEYVTLHLDATNSWGEMLWIAEEKHFCLNFRVAPRTRESLYTNTKY